MIYLVVGSDFNRAQNTFQRYLSIFRSKQPAAGVFNFSPDTFTVANWEEVVRGQTLFAGKNIVTCWRLSEQAEAKGLVEEEVGDLANSANAFLFYESGEDEKFIKLLTKHAKEVKTFDVKEAEEQIAFNVFSLTDALGARDRQRLWVLYQQALRADVPAMEIFWKFSWQVKNMIIVTTAKDVQKTPLKPFVAAKALKASRNFTDSELRHLANSLADLLDQTYPESEEFNLGLEKIVLNV